MNTLDTAIDESDTPQPRNLRRRGAKFDATITLGNVIQIILILAAITGFFITKEKAEWELKARLANVETAQSRQELAVQELTKATTTLNNTLIRLQVTIEPRAAHSRDDWNNDNTGNAGVVTHDKGASR